MFLQISSVENNHVDIIPSMLCYGCHFTMLSWQMSTFGCHFLNVGNFIHPQHVIGIPPEEFLSSFENQPSEKSSVIYRYCLGARIGRLLSVYCCLEDIIQTILLYFSHPLEVICVLQPFRICFSQSSHLDVIPQNVLRSNVQVYCTCTVYYRTNVVKFQYNR